MSDSHLHALRAAARHSLRKLRDHDASTTVVDLGSSERRVVLERKATNTRARLVAAQARRHRRPERDG